MTVDERRSRLKSWGLWLGGLYNTTRENFGAATGGVFSFSFFFFLFLFFGAGVEAMC